MPSISKKLKILHTSDWHLGRSLYGRQRYETFEAYLLWLIDQLRHNMVDVLLVAGDVFDTTTPGNRAQTLYYQFLHAAASSGCRHVIITAGNHDSPSFLEAPRALLRVLNVHVIGNISHDFEDEVLVLNDESGEPELIVCAVPYLRDRDIRMSETGESIEDKELKITEGIRQHYADVAVFAQKKRASLKIDVPIIAMGHLFTAGGQTADGDGVRELYIGSLAHVSADVFSNIFSYVALGHLHISQKVNGCHYIRYSGSPIPMGFGEANQKKSVCLVTLSPNNNLPDTGESEEETNAQLIENMQFQVTVENLLVPVFQKMTQIKGDLPTILTKIQALADTKTSIWLEIIYEGAAVIPDLREKLESAAAETKLEILRIKNDHAARLITDVADKDETLDDLTEIDVFERCLSAHDISEPHRSELLHLYQGTVNTLYEEDSNAQ